MLWIKEGDNNTKFFHKMANSRRRFNHLSILEVDGVIYEEESKVAAQVVKFYKNLYQEIEEWRPFVEGLEFDQIDGSERGWLERRFEKEEILLTVNELARDKAPGSNGFSMAFFYHCWRVVESDLEAMFDFLETIYGSSIRGLGEDKMCWIPSKVKGFLVSDYYRILAGSAFFGFPWKSIWK